MQLQMKYILRDEEEGNGKNRCRKVAAKPKN